MSAKPVPSKKGKVVPKIPKKKVSKLRPPVPGKIDVWSLPIEIVAQADLELPSVPMLATLAAAIVNPGEEPQDTASRAMALWLACDEVIHETKQAVLDANRDDDFEQKATNTRLFQQQQWNAFRAACGLKFREVWGSNGKNVKVPLTTFFAAFKIGTKTNAKEFLKKWGEFRKSETAELGSGKSVDGFGFPGGFYQISSDPEASIPYPVLRDCWHSCSRFIESEREVKKSNLGTKMARVKKIRQIARSVLAGEKLEPLQIEFLKSVTDEERKAEIAKLNMDPKSAGRWNAAIQSFKLPAKARPRAKKGMPSK